jgi:hypothetical protein
MTQAKSTKTPPTDPKEATTDAGGGKTKVEQGGEAAPRLPHERDQSSDSQQTPDGQPTKVGRQAHEDVERGVVDTDRGPEADRVYNDKVKR